MAQSYHCTGISRRMLRALHESNTYFFKFCWNTCLPWSLLAGPTFWEGKGLGIMITFAFIVLVFGLVCKKKLWCCSYLMGICTYRQWSCKLGIYSQIFVFIKSFVLFAIHQVYIQSLVAVAAGFRSYVCFFHS